MPNQFAIKYPSLWDLCRQAVRTHTGQPARPAAHYYIPRQWIQRVSRAATASRNLTLLVPDAAERAQFVARNQAAQAVLLQRCPALEPLQQVLNAVCGGALRAAFLDVTDRPTPPKPRLAGDVFDPNGRHYAIKVDGTVVTFACPNGHEYTDDYSKKPVAQRLGPTGTRLMAQWWDKAHGGVVAPPCHECWPARTGKTS